MGRLAQIELRLWLETGGERHEASHFIPRQDA
jgi:hypothetical protein